MTKLEPKIIPSLSFTMEQYTTAAYAYFTLECLLYSVLAFCSQPWESSLSVGILLFPLFYERTVFRENPLSAASHNSKRLVTYAVVYSVKTLLAFLASLRVSGVLFNYLSIKLCGNAVLLVFVASVNIEKGRPAYVLGLMAANAITAGISLISRLGECAVLALGECVLFGVFWYSLAISQETEDKERSKTIKEFIMGFPEAIMILNKADSVVLKNNEGFILFDKTKKWHEGTFEKFTEKLKETNQTGASLQQDLAQFRKDIDSTYERKMQWTQDYYFEDDGSCAASSKNVAGTGLPSSKERCIINVTMWWLADPLYQRDDRGEILLVFKDVSDRGALRDQKLADNMKSMLISTMSHELRTPLNGIIGIMNMISEKLPAGLKGWWNAAQISAQLLLNTVNCMLDFSQLEMHKFATHSGMVNMRTLFAELLALFEEIIPKDKVTLVQNVAPEVPVQFRSDTARLRQILMNLLSNAANYTFKGSITLSASMCVQGVMKVEVNDTGLGMSKEKQATLFKLFGGVTADPNAIAAKMAGLGLTVSNKLVQELGGTFSVQSTQDVGSSFAFTIKEFPVEPPKMTPRMRPNCLARENGTRFRNTSDHEIKFKFDCKPEQRRSTIRTLLLKKSITLVGCEPRFNPLQLGISPGKESALPEARKDEELDDKDEDDSNSGDEKSESCEGDVGEELAFPRAILDSVNLIHRTVNPTQFSFDVGTKKSKAMSEDLNEMRRKKLRPCDIEVLVVDDNSINRLVLSGMLKNLGYFPKEVCNGKEAYEAVLQADGRFDIILMDVQMPLMDGIQATYKIRELYKDLPIVGVTALDSELDLRKCIDAGMNDTLTKPLSLQDVQMTMQRYDLLRNDPLSEEGE